MKIPISTELRHLAPGYDPQQAHDYYLRTRHLKGRKKGQAAPPPTVAVGARRGKRPRPPHNPAKEKQKLQLQTAIKGLEAKLAKLEALIKEKEAVLKRDQASKKAAGRKKKDTPKTAADKAKSAREAKKYRKKHHQELKTKARQAAKSGGGSKGSKAGGAKKPKDMSIADLKALATKVKGQLAVAKQKLAAL